MTQPTEQFHGSDIEKIEQVFGIQKEKIVNLSANVNPLGISYRLREELPLHIDAISSYPDREYTALRKAIGKYIHADERNILVGNGTTDLISLASQLICPKKALIVGPTYSEYAHEISLAGGCPDYFRLREEDGYRLDIDRLCKALTPDIDMLVICNPNNPTSTQVSCKEMCSILNHCKENKIFAMIDETYVEFSENSAETTAVPLAQEYQNVIVLRGISKFFAAPGLRLGYATCCSQELKEKVGHLKKPWSINSLAAIAGGIMFSDTAYIRDTQELIFSERKRICNILNRYASTIKYYEPHANFILLRILKEKVTSSSLFEAAIQKGLMIRDCSSFPFLDSHYIRFCFMKPETNNALLDVLLPILA